MEKDYTERNESREERIERKKNEILELLKEDGMTCKEAEDALGRAVSLMRRKRVQHVHNISASAVLEDTYTIRK